MDKQKQSDGFGEKAKTFVKKHGIEIMILVGVGFISGRRYQKNLTNVFIAKAEISEPGTFAKLIQAASKYDNSPR